MIQYRKKQIKSRHPLCTAQTMHSWNGKQEFRTHMSVHMSQKNIHGHVQQELAKSSKSKIAKIC